MIFNQEMHKTESKYENSLTLKLFVLLCVNYYAQAFYISFIKGRLQWTLFGSVYYETVSLRTYKRQIIQI